MAIVSTKIRVTTEGTTGEVFIRTLEQTFSKDVLYRDLNAVKTDILNETEDFIDRSRKRDKERHTEEWRTTRENNLINTLKTGSFIEQTRSNRVRLRIGDINLLNKNAPYWYLINYGGRIDMKGKEFIPGYFGRGNPPGVGGRENFHYTGVLKGTNSFNSGPNSFRMIPINPIPPMKYLNFMAKQFDIKMKELAAQYSASLRKKAIAVKLPKIEPTIFRGVTEEDFWK